MRVVEDMGFPAGLARTTIADLTGRLPPGTRRIRIATNLQIYWDQVLVDRTAPGIRVHTTDVPLLEFNTRFYSGEAESEYRFRYTTAPHDPLNPRR